MQSLLLQAYLTKQHALQMLSAVACSAQILSYDAIFALPHCISGNVCIRQVFGRCSQTCVEMPAAETGYRCECAEGYSLQRNGYICQANGEDMEWHEIYTEER